MPEIDFDDMKTLLLNTYCVGCHTGGACPDHDCAVWQLMKKCDEN